MDNKLGKIISELRNKEGLTQRELAEKLNVSDKTVSHWETGENLPQIDMLNHISKYFKVPLNDLIIARVSDEGHNDSLAHDLIASFQKSSERKSKIIRIILSLGFILLLTLIFTIIFSSTYNRFKVYNVSVESDDFYKIHGVYVETKINDTLFIDSIRIKDYEEKPSDIITVNIYYKENGKKVILTSFDRLNRLEYFTSDGYIKIEDLSNFENNLYIEVVITNKDNESIAYSGQIKFDLNFTNNHNYYEKQYDNFKTIKLTVDEIKRILINNKFIEISNDYLERKHNNKLIQYFILSNKISYCYEKEDLYYKYVYNIKMNEMNIFIYNENNVEIENYTYEITNDKVTECNVGSCNGYKEALELLEKDVLYLLK